MKRYPMNTQQTETKSTQHKMYITKISHFKAPVINDIASGAEHRLRDGFFSFYIFVRRR